MPDVDGATVAPGAVNTAQSLTPQEQSYGQALGAQADQQAAQDAQLSASPQAWTQPSPSAPPVGAGMPSLDWQPQTVSAPPAARLQSINPYAQQPSLQSGQGPAQMRPIGAPASPFGGLAKDASLRSVDSAMGVQDALGKLDQAAQLRQQAAADVGAAKAETAGKQAAVLDTVAELNAQKAKQDKQALDAHMAATSEVQEKAAQVQDWLDKNSEVKDSRSTSQRVGSAIAIGLGTFASGWLSALSGTQQQNIALDLINQGINRDLDAQQARINNKKTALAGYDSILGRSIQQFGNNQQARDAAHAALLQQASTQIDAEKMRGLSKEAMPVATDLQAQIAGEVAQRRLGIDQQNYTSALGDKQAAVAGDANYKMQAAHLAATQANQRAEAAGKKQPLQNGQDTPLGRKIERADVYNQLSAEEQSKLLQSEDATRDLRTGIADLLKVRKEHGVAIGVPGTDAYEQAGAAHSRVQLALKKKGELGTLDKGSEAFLAKMAGDPNAWFINTPETKLGQILSTEVRSQNDRARRAGLAGDPALKTRAIGGE